ncbi:DUF3575 domain-containing protein [Niabella hirudinis]|uniref:DUF3575 domain-containing protein n=1 Tax=Niabella hirudinis TaxID=1285929 RepID=UPI003EB6F117
MKFFSTLLLVFLYQLTLSQNLVSADGLQSKRSIIKLNLISPVLKNYSVQYEQVLTKRLSLALGARIMPASTLPFRQEIRKKIVDEDIDFVNEAIDKLKFSNYAITPELRFYPGRKGYGRGFYLAPYYRFAQYTIKEGRFSFDENGEHYDIDASGKVTAHTGGLLMGAQWQLGKTLGLDFWIAGPGIGGASGDISGKSSPTLSPDDQEELRTQLKKVDIPLTKETIYVDANGGKIGLSGPWAGIRSGLLLTFRL